MAAAEQIEGGKSSPDAAPTPAGVSTGEAVNPPAAPPKREETTPTPLAPAGPLVEIGGLYVTFQRRGQAVPALRGIDLQIAPGEILGLVGESGSGKSVLGLSLLGLLAGDPPPQISGVALVAGVDMVAASADERRRLRRKHLGAVFQDPMTSLNPTMRVGRQVAEAAGTESEAVRLLDAVGVPDPRRRLKSFPHELSGGLRQRVMIAMAVAGEPSLVVADEPTTALDVTVQAQILELLRHLCDTTGCTFVLVTHDLGVAAQVADRIAVLYAGRLAEIGRAADVLDSPAHPYSVGLLRSRLTLAARRDGPLPTLPGEPPDPRALPAGCPFGPRCGLHQDACDDALPTLVAAGRHPGVAACIRLGSTDVAAPPVLEPWSQVVAVKSPERRARAPVAAVASGAPGAGVASGAPGGGAVAVRLAGVEKEFVLRGGWRHKERLQALRGIDLEVAEGESLALVGESGCGKSTLLRTVAGLLAPTRGSISLGAHGSRPQMVFQDAGASLTPWLTVGELVGERLRAEGTKRGDRAAKVRDALALVGLPAEVAGAKANQLSGGQRQRVALARATIVPPEVLLCDEPTSALDVSLAATVLNLLGRIRRELGMAMLFVTHDLGAARVVADRVAVMYLGRIVEIGPAEEIVASPRHPYTKALLGAVPAVGVVRSPLQGEPASPLQPPSGCPFHPRCDVALESCSSAHVPLLQIGRRSVACVRADDLDGMGPASTKEVVVAGRG
jgi:peptide/nickel transport system ATP-binding protein